jgi:hypothetical protein
MKTQEYVYEHKPKPREYMLALAYNMCYVKLLDFRDKPYASLALWFIKNEAELKDDDIPYPSINGIALEFGTDSKKITKWLKDIYDDIITLNQAQKNKFLGTGQIMCNLTFRYLGAATSFNLGLSVIPATGAHFEFNFIHPMIGRTGYFVSKIYHYLENGSHRVHIILEDEEPFLYYQLLKEKAYLENRISYAEYLGLHAVNNRNLTNQDIKL